MIKSLKSFIVVCLAALALAACSLPLGAGLEAGDSSEDGASRGFSANNASMYLRGTNNNWSTTAMSLVANNTWELSVRFYGFNGSADAFKFDATGNWSKNWGDNNADGYADVNGANIVIPSSGNFRVRFNDATRAYSVTRLADVQLYFKHLNGDPSSMSTELRGLTVRVYRDGSEIFAPGGVAFVVAGGGYAQPPAELRFNSALPGNYRVVVDQVKAASSTYINYGTLRFRAEYTFSLNGNINYSYGQVDVASNALGNTVIVHFREWQAAQSYSLRGWNGLPGTFALAYEGYINGNHWWVATIKDAPTAFSFSFLNSNGGVDSGTRSYSKAANGQEFYVEAFNSKLFATRP